MLLGLVPALRSAFGWMMDRLGKGEGNRNPDLPDDVLLEILSRLPSKSVCRFKCVSRHWLHGLITHPDFRTKIPQPLTGFFCHIEYDDHSDAGEDNGEDDDGYDSADDREDNGEDDDGYDSADDGEDSNGEDDDGYDSADDSEDSGEDDDGYDSADDGEDNGEDDDDGYDFADHGEHDDGHDFADHGYDSADEETTVPDFFSIVGETGHQVASPSLAFLPLDVYRSIVPKHCSDGLLVCLCWKVAPANESDYVVCNPATQQWVTLPGHGHSDRSLMPLHLAVDTASGHFHVFALLEDLDGYFAGVDIYSSETGAWRHKETGWVQEEMPYQHSVFLHGMLHLVSRSRTIVAVDTKGSTWKTIHLLERMKTEYFSNAFFIGKSQGRMHYVSNSHDDYYTLSVWMLEGDDEWIYKHRIGMQAIFGSKYRTPQDCIWYMLNISLVAIHPGCNTVFFTVSDSDDGRIFVEKLISYDMGHGRSRLLNCRTDELEFNPYLPYVPSWRSIPL